ncbi:hypothetical protein SCT_0718 [Sulfuricella sp. T08]|uniref:exonuclease domain-containing protein n=1 Tax=Sulfuricella sp. T08 TaxID=1632857 RepID=UPI00061797FD|nr:exonuclease domain-containing protein [Sulfuricella sp. T08]GAO35332.1 hypothetical protein SCT_0718 [Sulfuricella sp. T08]
MTKQHDLLPEERELEQRLTEIASLEAALSEKELELATRAESIQRFHTRYQQMVGTLYAELDAIEAGTARLEANAKPRDKQAQAAAAAASERAAQSAWESSATPEDAAAAEPFAPTDELKNLYRAAARRLHPDRGASDADRSLRNDLMAQVNVAYRAGDQARIEAIIAEYRDHPEAIEGDDVGARLIRTIRQKSRLAARLREVEEELLQLENGELADLQREAETRAEQGEDALAELAAQLSERIAAAKKILEEKRNILEANAAALAASIDNAAKGRKSAETDNNANVFRPEGLIHCTERGEKVRSKSEVIIANLLHQARLDYQYELDLSTLGLGRGVRPDFAFQRGTKVIVWEHLGRADDPDYMARWAQKLTWYRDHGFESGKTLFVSTEMAGQGIDVASLGRVVAQIQQVLATLTEEKPAKPQSVQPQAATPKPGRHTVDEALVFFDFETTGLKPAGCRVIEVGAVKVVNGVVVETFTSLIDPGVQLSSEITNITGITNAMLKGQSRPAEVMPKLHNFMRGAAIVAHNAKFDQGFLKMEFDRLGLSVPSNLLCTMKLAKRVEPGLRSYSLAALTSHFSLNANSNAHRALPDAHQTVALWQALEKQLLKQAELQRIPVALMLKLQAVAVSDVKRFLRERG